MKILNELEQNSEEWFETRKGKITGSKLRGIVPLRGTAKKIGFYELLADRLAVPETGEPEDERERGHRLEPEAIKLFSEQTGMKVESVGMCVSDNNPNMAYSPDGLVREAKKYVINVEVKCLSSARHLQALIEKKIPTDGAYNFTAQNIQAFIVNEDCERNIFVFYDPRVTAKPLHWIEINRKDVEKEIEFYQNYQEETLKEIDALLEELTF